MSTIDNCLPLTIADDQLRSMQTNLSIPQNATNFDDLPLFDIFENLDDIFMETGNIDPDLNLRHGVQCECKYIDQSEVDGLTNDSSLNSFGMINVRSLQRNLDDFLHLFRHVLDHVYIIGLTETWLGDRRADLYSIPGFKGSHNYHTLKLGGGVSIFVKASLTFEPLKNLSLMTSSIETVFIKIGKCSLKINRDLIIGVCYSPPSGDKKEFNIRITEILDSINHDLNYVYLMGDFNINLFEIMNSTESLNFYNLMQSYLMFPQFNRPTRVTLHNQTLIDNIFTNNTLNTNNTKY